MTERDQLHRFLFEHAAIRGELVHLDATWQAVLERHIYPSVVKTLLGEMLAASALLSATLKFSGRMIMQLQGSGPITLLVVECDHQRHMRAIAHWAGDLPEGDLAALAGDGRLVITIEQAGSERYQSIVALTGRCFADAMTDYLLRSVQLDTLLWLATDDHQAAGLLIQKLPDESGDSENWNRIQALTSTIRKNELLTLGAREILHRLYHEEDVRLFDAEPVAFRCSCSRERVSNMLRSLGENEVQDILSEQGSVEVACEFCNQKYSFDSVDAAGVFTTVPAHDPPERTQ